MNQVQLLLVEDDESLGATLKQRLEKEGYTVHWAQSVRQAEQIFELSPLQLCLLDVGLPDGSGFEFAKKIKQRSSIPFIFITAQVAAEDRLKGYELGADEYIPKPFHLKELLIRVRHVLENHVPPQKTIVGDYEIDFDQYKIRHSTGEQMVPTRDMKLLRYLIEQSPKVVSRDIILNQIWGEDSFPSNRTIDNAIVRLRQSFSEYPRELIRSVRGVGYQWVHPEGENGE